MVSAWNECRNLKSPSPPPKGWFTASLDQQGGPQWHPNPDFQIVFKNVRQDASKYGPRRKNQSSLGARARRYTSDVRVAKRAKYEETQQEKVNQQLEAQEKQMNDEFEAEMKKIGECD